MKALDRWPRILVGLLFISASACSTSHPAIQETAHLAPRSGDSTTPYSTLDQIAPLVEGVDTAALDMEALSRMAVIGTDSLVAVFGLFEYPSLLYLDVWMYNGTAQEIDLEPEMVVLVDGSKMQFRQLQPHEAANLFIGQIRGVTLYQPKTSYQVNTYQSGNYSSSTVTPYTDVGESIAQLGSSISAAIVTKQNNQLVNAANVLYEQGLVDGTTLAPDAALRFGIFWLNRERKSYPLEVRILETTRVPFVQVRGH